MSRAATRAAAVIAACALGVGASAQAPPPPGAAPPIPTKPPEAAREAAPGRTAPHAVAGATREGTDALLQGRAQEAMDHYGRAQVRAPLVPEIAYDRGVAALVAGDPEEAEKALALSQQLAQAPREDGVAAPPAALLDDAHYNLGHAALQRDELPAAVQRWAQVLARDGSAEDARRNLELALRLMDQQQQQEQQQQDQQDQSEDENEEQGGQGGGGGEGEQEQPSGGGQPPEPPPGEDQPPPEQQGRPEPRQGPISREQAEQLLAQLAAEEQRAMEDEAQERARAASSASGKTW